MPPIRQKISKVTSHLAYTPILGFAAFLTFVRIGLYARLLDVSDFGLLSKLLLISSLFFATGSFGFRILAQRDLPKILVGGRYRKSLILLWQAAIVTTITILIAWSASLFGLSILGISSMTLLWALIHGWAQQIFMLAVIDTRSRLQMTRYSWQIFSKTILSSAVALIIAYMGGGAVGIIIGELIITLLLTAQLFRQMLQQAGMTIMLVSMLSFKMFRMRSFWVAMSLFAGTTLVFLSTNIDRWLAANYLSENDFGLYSFAWISITIALSIQALLNASIFPLLSRKHIEGSHGGGALRITLIMSTGLLLLSLIAALIADKTADWLIPIWYPQYVDALPLLLPLLLAAALRISDFWSSYLVVVHRQNTLLKIQIILISLPCLFYLLGGAEHSWPQTSYDFALLALFLSVGNFIANAFACLQRKNK